MSQWHSLKLTLLLVVIWDSLDLAVAQKSCCPRIEVGGEVYDRMENAKRPPLARFRCYNKCVYTKLTEAESMYCFRFGGESTAKCVPVCACGKKGPDWSGSSGIQTGKGGNRIVNGDDTSTEEWPWYVYVHKYYSTRLSNVAPDYAGVCGGTLITEKWILTAAHCTFRGHEDWVWPNDFPPRLLALPSAINISLGVDHAYGAKVPDNFKKFDFSRKGRYPIITYLYPEIYLSDSESATSGDISLLRVDGKVDLMQYPNICLPPPSYKSEEHEDGWIIGHGSIIASREEYIAPSRLQEGRVKITHNNSICFEAYKYASKSGKGSDVPLDGICTGGNFQAGCGGDSGGPLMVAYPNDKERMMLYGVFSYSGEAICPDWFVYISVPHHINWIEEQMSQHGGAGARCY